MIGGIRSRLVDYEALLAEAPGVEAMEKLFQRLDGILFCIKDREGCYLSANDAFLQRARVEDPCDLIVKNICAVAYQNKEAHTMPTIEGKKWRCLISEMQIRNYSMTYFIMRRVLSLRKQSCLCVHS